MIKSSSYIYKKSKIRKAKPDWKLPEGRYIYRKSKIREVKPHRGDIYLHYQSNVNFFSRRFCRFSRSLKKILLIFYPDSYREWLLISRIL